MEDPLDVKIEDPELDHEIELLSDLMVLAAKSPGRLDEAAVDAVLLAEQVPHQGAPGIDRARE